MDLAVLLARPGMEAHYTQLMGSPIHFNDQARREYESRTRNLQEAIADA